MTTIIGTFMSMFGRARLALVRGLDYNGFIVAELRSENFEPRAENATLKAAIEADRFEECRQAATERPDKGEAALQWVAELDVAGLAQVIRDSNDEPWPTHVVPSDPHAQAAPDYIHAAVEGAPENGEHR
jgi:hypothetical protein